MKRFVLAHMMLLLIACGTPPQLDQNKQVQGNGQEQGAESTKREQTSTRDDIKRLKLISKDVFTGRLQQAEPDARAYVQDYPESAEGHRILGWLTLKQDNLEEAKKLFQKTLDLDSENDNAYVGLGSIARAEQDFEQAVKYYNQAIEIKAANPEAYSSLSVIHILRRDYDTAIKTGEKALKYDFEDPTLYANLAIAYHYSKDKVNRDKYYQLAEKNGYPNSARLQKIFSGELKLR